jgi:hypothetical protein
VIGVAVIRLLQFIARGLEIGGSILLRPGLLSLVNQGLRTTYFHGLTSVGRTATDGKGQHDG